MLAGGSFEKYFHSRIERAFWGHARCLNEYFVWIFCMGMGRV
jgi:hypothetical protein